MSYSSLSKIFKLVYGLFQGLSIKTLMVIDKESMKKKTKNVKMKMSSCLLFRDKYNEGNT